MNPMNGEIKIEKGTAQEMADHVANLIFDYIDEFGPSQEATAKFILNELHLAEMERVVEAAKVYAGLESPDFSGAMMAAVELNKALSALEKARA